MAYVVYELVCNDGDGLVVSRVVEIDSVLWYINFNIHAVFILFMNESSQYYHIRKMILNF